MPPVEANPLTLQTLSMAKLNTNLNRSMSSLENTVDFLEKEQKSEPPKLSFHGVMLACFQGHTWSLKDTSKSLQFLVTDTKTL